MSCSALERAPALFIPTRRGSTISLNVVRKFAWYKTNVATTPSCSVICKKKIIHPVRRKKRKNQRTSKGRSRDRIDSISEFSSTSNNDVETGIGSPSSALGGLVMSPPRKEEIASEIEERTEEAPVGNQGRDLNFDENTARFETIMILYQPVMENKPKRKLLLVLNFKSSIF